MAIKITTGSENGFRDFGLSFVVAEHLRIRAELTLALEQVIERRRLTPSRAAKLLGISQRRMSDLGRGRLHRFSIDALVDMLARSGCTFTSQPRAARRATGARARRHVRAISPDSSARLRQDHEPSQPGGPIERKVAPVEREHATEAFPFSDAHERCIGEVHREIAVLVHQVPESGSVGVVERRERERLGRK